MDHVPKLKKRRFFFSKLVLRKEYLDVHRDMGEIRIHMVSEGVQRNDWLE